MTQDEFSRNYATLEEAFGARANIDNGKHFALWWQKFGNWPCYQFAEAVDYVIDNHRTYGSDKWPTVGDFNHLTNRMPQTYKPEPYLTLDDNQREYDRLRWKITQLPKEERNNLLRKAVNAVHSRNVPEYMKAACGAESLLDAVLENMKVRIYCQENGIEFPIDRPIAKPRYENIQDEIKHLDGYDWFNLRQWALADIRKTMSNYNPNEDLVFEHMIRIYEERKIT